LAINKKQASPAVKAGIIVVAVMLVLAFALPLVSPSLFSGSSATPGTGESGQLETIGTQYSGTVNAYQQQLASDPTSYTVLVGIGNTYSDWANAILQYQGVAGGADLPVWVASARYYERALEVQPGDPNVGTDLAISYYYSGDIVNAIATVETVMAANPDFPPAYFNAAIFYKAANMPGQAVAAAQTFLQLDPEGQYGNPDSARAIVDELGSAAATGTP